MIVPALDAPQPSGRRFPRLRRLDERQSAGTGTQLLHQAHHGHQVRGVIRGVNYQLDVNTLEQVPASKLELNRNWRGFDRDTSVHFFFDSYSANRITGAFIVIDPLSNETVGAGMIADIEGQEGRGAVSPAEAHSSLAATRRHSSSRTTRKPRSSSNASSSIAALLWPSQRHRILQPRSTLRRQRA